MIAGLIQARTKSQRCSNKMLRNFAGNNLISIALEKFSVKPKSFKLYFAAHEEKLLRIGREYDCNIIERDDDSAMGEKIETVMNYLTNIPEDYIMFINACCPFLTIDTLERAIQCFNKNNALSMTAVVKTHTWYYFLNGRPVNFLDPTNLNTKTSEPLYAVTHAFHIFNKKRFIENHYFWAHREMDPYFFEIPEKEAIDIDTELDFKKAEALYMAEHGRIKRALKEKIAGVKMLIMDVDGVLTDAGMYYSKNGDELKKFNTRDGMGLTLLRKAGIKQAIITGEDTQIVKDRAKKLKIDELYLGVEDKLSIFHNILSKHSLEPDEVAFIGDDVNDIGILKKVGLACTVPDAPYYVKHHADYVTGAKGGEGAVREICDMILSQFERSKND